VTINNAHVLLRNLNLISDVGKYHAFRHTVSWQLVNSELRINGESSVHNGIDIPLDFKDDAVLHHGALINGFCIHRVFGNDKFYYRSILMH